jgi:hypothetical protein
MNRKYNVVESIMLLKANQTQVTPLSHRLGL